MITANRTGNPDDSPNRAPASSWTLFNIGFSAGLIAALFPRLIPLLGLKSGQDSIGVQLINPGFLIISIVFGVLIGVAMIWLNAESKESSKNLFMSALALPGILSGGISMSNNTSVSQHELAMLLKENAQLERELNQQIESGANIRILDETIHLEPLAAIDNDNAIISSFILDAQAADSSGAKKTVVAQGINLNPSIQYQIKSPRQKYVVVLQKSPNRSDIKKKKEELTKKGISGLNEMRGNSKFYLIKGEPKSKRDALRESIDIRQSFNIEPTLVRVN